MAGIRRTPADKWYSDCVRERNFWTCESCFRYFPEGRARQGIHVAHFYGRRHRGLRWHAHNGFCLCAGCHFAFGDSPSEWVVWVEGKLGAGMMEILKERKNSIYKMEKGEEKEIAKHYRDELKLMQETRAGGNGTGRIEFLSWY